MTLKKSPGGSIFPYYYKDGEIFGLHFGSFYADEAGLLARMKAEEEFIANTLKQFPLWVDFYQTQLTEPIVTEFLHSFQRLQSHIVKLAIYGCSRKDQRRLRQVARKSGIVFPFPLKFFDDPEIAKTWLVSERS